MFDRILRLNENGILERLLKKHVPSPERCVVLTTSLKGGSTEEQTWRASFESVIRRAVFPRIWFVFIVSGFHRRTHSRILPTLDARSLKFLNF